MSTLESPPVRKRQNAWRWIPLAALLLVAVVVVKIVIPVYRQERAIAKFESVGFGTIVQSERIGPEWFWKHVEPEHWRGCDRVMAISQERFSGFTISMMIMDGHIGKPRRLGEVTYSGIPKIDLVAADLQAVCGHSLRELDLRHMTIHATILDGAYDATNLEFLDLAETDIDDHTLKQIAQFQKLKFLYLEKTNITDAGLKHLGNLTSLRELALDDTDISDEGLLALGELHDLRKLWLPNTKVTDGGLRALEKMPHLEIVDLNGTRVTDAGIMRLKAMNPEKLTHLRSVFLDETRVTSRLLQQLGDLSNLKFLDVGHVSTTYAQIDRLRESIPGLDVRYGISPSPSPRNSEEP